MKTIKVNKSNLEVIDRDGNVVICNSKTDTFNGWYATNEMTGDDTIEIKRSSVSPCIARLIDEALEYMSYANDQDEYNIQYYTDDDMNFIKHYDFENLQFKDGYYPVKFEVVNG